MKNETISSFLLWWWWFFIIVFVKLFIIFITFFIIIKLLFVSIIIEIFKFVLFDLLVAVPVEPVQNLEVRKTILMKILRFEHFLSVTSLTGDWIVSKIDLLKVFKFSECCDTINFCNVILVKDQLTQVFIIEQFHHFTISQSSLLSKFTCFR